MAVTVRAGYLLPAAVALALCFDQIPAPPAIEPDGIWNAASMAPPSLPAGGIARGARIVISGVRMGPAHPVQGSESAPPEKLANVTVQIESGGTRVPAGLFSVSAERIEAWIPESVPAGPARLTVTYEGRESEPYSLAVQASGFGFFSTGRFSERQSAAPGDAVTLWGSGAGASDLDIFLGGAGARLLPPPADASCCKGVSGVSFEVPRDAPLGCYVPVVGRSRSTSRPTNVTAIAVHRFGEPCHDRIDWFRRSVEASTSAGFAVLARVSFLFASEENVFDYGLWSFGRQEAGQRPFPPFPPFGTCTAFTERMNLRELFGESRAPGAWPAMVKAPPGNRVLDAGAIQIQGPNGAKVMSKPGILGGRVPFSHTPPQPLFTSPGRYKLFAAGGSDIGPFTASIAVPNALVWTNRARAASVDRAAGVTVRWKASRREDAILIVAAGADHITGDSAMCVCMAPAAAGRFRIPALALADLPPADPHKPEFSYLILLEVPVDPPAPIAASGLDSGFAAFLSASVRTTLFR